MKLIEQIKNNLLNLNLFIQKHFVAFVIISILLMIIINTFWFSMMDPNGNSDDFAFNRTTIKVGEKDEDGKKIDEFKFISNSFTDACHYTFTTMSTIGYGDITPKSSNAKYWTMVMHIIAIIMSLKVFEYFISDDASSKALLKRINELDAENEELKQTNTELIDNNRILQTSCGVAIQKFKRQLIKKREFNAVTPQ